MRKNVKVPLASSMVLALLVGALGCASSTPASPTAAPAAAAAPTKAPAAQPAGQVIELKYHHHEPAQSITHEKAHAALAKLIEEKTSGRVKVTVYPAETLGKSTTAVDMAVNGIADIAWGTIGNFAGRFPLTEVLGLPMLGLESAPQATKVLWELYQTSPEIQKEWDSVKMILLHTNAPAFPAFGSKKVQSLEDMKGLRVRSPAGTRLKYLQAIGAQPVTVPAAETFEALQKGTIDGVTFDWTGLTQFRLHEISKYALEESIDPATFFVIMNKKRWDSLPPDIQKTLNDLIPAAVEMYGQAWNAGAAAGRQAGLQKGMEIVKLSDQERARWQKAAEPVWQEYIKLADSKGANGKALVEKARSLVSKHKP